jgi:hypothetical protein
LYDRNLSTKHYPGGGALECWNSISGGKSFSTATGNIGATTSYAKISSVQPVEPRRVLYSYYTAGSGGVGPTILETSLLLAGTPVTVYANGEKVALQASQYTFLLRFCRYRAVFGRGFPHASAKMVAGTFLNSRRWL